MFTEDLSVFFNTDEFAVVATINNVSVNGIFDREFVSVSSGKVQIEGFRPVFTCATSDVSGVTEDDLVVVDTVTYRVAFPEPDGTGITRLILRK